MLDKELLEQFQLLTTAMESMETRLTEKMATKEDLKRLETRINIKIENDITRRLDSLTDGYKLTHEKQFELERRMDKLEQVIADLQNRIA